MDARADKQTTDLGPLEEFPEGAFRVMRVGKREIGVYRSSSGEVFAIANFCPHRGAPLCKGPVGGTLIPSEPGELVYGMDGDVVRCPWHGYEFSLHTGECLFTGQRMRAKTYPVSVEDGRVRVSGIKSGETK